MVVRSDLTCACMYRVLHIHCICGVPTCITRASWWLLVAAQIALLLCPWHVLVFARYGDIIKHRTFVPDKNSRRHGLAEDGWRPASREFPLYTGNIPLLGLPAPERFKNKLDRTGVFVNDQTKQVVIVTLGLAVRSQFRSTGASAAHNWVYGAVTKDIIIDTAEDVYAVLTCVRAGDAVCSGRSHRLPPLLDRST